MQMLKSFNMSRLRGPMRSNHRIDLAIIITFACIAALAVIASVIRIPLPFRLFAAIGGVLLGPGTLACRLATGCGWIECITVGVAINVAIVMMLGLSLVSAHFWHPLPFELLIPLATFLLSITLLLKEREHYPVGSYQETPEDSRSTASMAMVGKAGMRPKVSVVICAYSLGRWEDLQRAIQSVRKQTEVAEEIVLVVDHCPELLKQANLLPLDIIVIPNRFEKGLSGARNTGAVRARGDIVAFLDDDAAADPDWLTRIVNHYEDPRILGVGGMVRPYWEGGRPRWFPSELDWVVGCCYRGMPSSSAPVRNFIGANMSFRRAVLQDSGGFSHGLGQGGAIPPGCEEAELCLRISQRNPDGILLYEPAAAVRHRVSYQRATWSYLRSRCYAEGLSKAVVARLAGPDRVLASERAYARSAVPRGIWRSLADAAHGKLAGALAALALVVAVAVTATGYLVGTITGRGSSADFTLVSSTPGTAANDHRATPAARGWKAP